MKGKVMARNYFQIFKSYKETIKYVNCWRADNVLYFRLELKKEDTSEWFQYDLSTYQAISDIVSKSEIMNDTIAISVYDKEDENANIIAAKSADELLTIGGITASFVLGRIDQKIYISGRSIGDINVQVILEKLGGGGHITLAGAQLEDITLEDAKQELINRINEYFFEEAN